MKTLREEIKELIKLNVSTLDIADVLVAPVADDIVALFRKDIANIIKIMQEENADYPPEYQTALKDFKNIFDKHMDRS